MRHLSMMLVVMLALGAGVEVAAQQRPTLVAQKKKKKKGKKEEEAPKEESGEGDGKDAEPTGSLRRSNRMEFDARLIRGETAGSGAVFLFQRTPRALPSMVPLRTSYLKETVGETLGARGQKTFKKSKSRAVRDKLRKKKRRNKTKSKRSKKK